MNNVSTTSASSTLTLSGENVHPGSTSDIAMPLRVFGNLLGGALLGYAFCGKGFAYLRPWPAAPFFVGEVVLGLGLLAMFLSLRWIPKAVRTLPGGIYCGFALFGVIRTVPYLSIYGAESLRDAVLYGYGLFMLLTSELFTDRRAILATATVFRKFAFVTVSWTLLAIAITTFLGDQLPRTPWSEIPMIWFKGGDAVVHIAGAITYFVLVPRPSRYEGGSAPVEDDGRGWIWNGLAGIATVATLSRGAWVSIAASLALAAGLSGFRRVGKVLGLMLAGAACAALIGIPFIGAGRRQLSTEGVAELVSSTFTSAGAASVREPDGTKEWRLRWWGIIAQETIGGPYSWSGHGFGENLADIHGFQTESSTSEAKLRSPHSSHMSVLARMGIPGMLLWLTLHLALVLRLVAARGRAKRSGDQWLSGVLGWVLCWWVAFMVNSSFDVYFEGPQGGIWFWSVMGLGLAASAISPESRSQSECPSRPESPSMVEEWKSA